MPLDDLQRALGWLVAAPDCASGFEGGCDGLDLTPQEKAWLKQLPGSRGLDLTRYIQRSWREFGIYRTASLTTAVLRPASAREVVEAYLGQIPCQSLYGLPEAIAFLSFVLSRNPAMPHAVAVAQFERALLTSAQGAFWESEEEYEIDLSHIQTIKQHPLASIIIFTAPPEVLLGCLIGGNDLPPEGEQLFPVVVAPRLNNLWRPATHNEVSLFAKCEQPCAVEQLLGETPCSEKTLIELIRAGALVTEKAA
jgi:hypothetical protein